MPNLLASKRGRLTAFFFLYLTEGIPLGFVATAVATQLRRQGVGPEEIGAFIASFYIPWSFKFVVGPVVDLIHVERWGRRRMWIVGCQCLMVLTLVATVGVDLPDELKLFTILLLVHNVFAATQDVAIDALAVQVLGEHERGLANGLMFGAAYLGQTIGGSGVLWLTAFMPFSSTFFFVGACILSVTLLVALPLKEPRVEATPDDGGEGAAAHILHEIWTFLKDSVKAMFGSRPAFVGFLFALLPAGAMSLGLALQSNLAVEIGMTDAGIANLAFWSTVLSAGGCIAGGQLSDRIGRRRALGIYIALISIPVFYLSVVLKHHGWIMPVDVLAADRPIAPPALFQAFWIATLLYAVVNGLMYGTRTALFMDVTTPAVAATQFTAYMAVLNLVIAYSAKWQGWWIERFGYPNTLLVDGCFGLLCIFLLPLMTKRKQNAARAGP
jgi:PAT family beta-lactamase induction signal transducer AmpG